MEASAVEAQQVEQAQAEPKLEQPEQPHLEPQTEPAATVSDAEVKTRLAVLLGKSDLATTTGAAFLQRQPPLYAGRPH